MRFPSSSRQAWRGVFLALTLAAVSLRILAPPGFMTQAGPSGPQLVICTGHGPLVIDTGRTDRSKPPSGAKADPPCLFAGATAAPTPAIIRLPAVRLAMARAVSDPVRRDLTAGAGLISAPPPARGPPGE
jgi:hypothetical protein